MTFHFIGSYRNNEFPLLEIWPVFLDQCFFFFFYPGQLSGVLHCRESELGLEEIDSGTADFHPTFLESAILTLYVTLDIIHIW